MYENITNLIPVWQKGFCMTMANIGIAVLVHWLLMPKDTSLE